MIIDAHTHGLDGRSLDRLTDAGGQWAKETLSHLLTLAQNKPHLVDLEPRIEMLDRVGIDLQVVTPCHHLDSNLLPGPGDAQLGMARAINDNMAGFMERSKGRLLTAASIPLEALERGALEEMERAIKGLGLRAVTLPTNLRGKPLDLPEFEAFWARAAEMDIPVYIHPNDPVGHNDRSYEADYDMIHNFGWPYETVLTLSRLVFSGIMEKYPTLKVVSHHLGGGMIPFFWGRINETYAPAYQERTLGRVLPRPLYDYFSKFYYDTAVGGSLPALKCALEVFGPDQIVFATDAPWGPGSGEERLANYPKFIKALGLSEGDNKKIFEDNARKILNLGQVETG